MKKLILLVGLVIICAFICSCAYFQKASVPVKTITFVEKPSNEKLLILLPGIFESSRAFAEHGVIDALQACRDDMNITGVEMHFAYYKNKQMDTRLYQDVIQPAKAAGIKDIYLAGLSLGGLGSLIYRMQRPDDIKTVIAIAPYLGEQEQLLSYINKQEAAKDEDLYPIWQNLETTAKQAPTITLAVAEDDRYNYGQNWLAGLLTEQQLVQLPGKHNWQAFKPLWQQAIKQSGLCQ
jgi:pimeloyl-ACP methyl ester carboxylesterase